MFVLVHVVYRDTVSAVDYRSQHPLITPSHHPSTHTSHHGDLWHPRETRTFVSIHLPTLLYYLRYCLMYEMRLIWSRNVRCYNNYGRKCVYSALSGIIRSHREEVMSPRAAYWLCNIVFSSLQVFKPHMYTLSSLHIYFVDHSVFHVDKMGSRCEVIDVIIHNDLS